MCNDVVEAFCNPPMPYDPVLAVHIAGPAQPTAYDSERTGAGRLLTCIHRGAAPARPVLDASMADTLLRVA